MNIFGTVTHPIGSLFFPVGCLASGAVSCSNGKPHSNLGFKGCVILYVCGDMLWFGSKMSPKAMC
jgi:hypothetical protein